MNRHLPSKTTRRWSTKAKKNVVLISAMHHDATVDPTARKKKTDIVRFYNSTKGAVDALDKMAHTFTTKRVTRRWPMSMWFNTLDLSTVAARIIWSKKFPNDHLAARDTRQQFITKIAKQLCRDQLQRRLAIKTLSRTLRQTMQLYAEKVGKKSTRDRRRSGQAAGRKRATPTPKRSTPKKAVKRLQKQRAKQGRCNCCDWRSDRKTTMSCVAVVPGCAGTMH